MGIHLSSPYQKLKDSFFPKFVSLFLGNLLNSILSPYEHLRSNAHMRKK